MNADMIIILLLCVALVMLMIELFMPDFGICGGIGIISLIAAAVTAIRFTTYGLAIAILCLSLAVATVFAVYRTFKSKRAQGTLFLEEVDKADTSSFALQPGAIGITLTSLRPIGTVSFGGHKTDAICEHGTLEKDVQIIFTRVSEGKVYVQKYKMEGEN